MILLSLVELMSIFGLEIPIQIWQLSVQVKTLQQHFFAAEVQQRFPLAAFSFRTFNEAVNAALSHSRVTISDDRVRALQAGSLQMQTCT